MSSLLTRVWSQQQLGYVPHTSVSGETWVMVGRGVTTSNGASGGTTVIDTTGVLDSGVADTYNGRYWVRIISGSSTNGLWKRVVDDDGSGTLTLENNGYEAQITSGLNYELWQSPEPVLVIDSSSGETNAVDAVRAEADDFWNDYYLIPITGDRRGRIAQITDFASATGTYTLAASSGSLGLGGALAAGDVCLIRRFIDFTGLQYGITEGYEPRPGTRINFSIGDGVVTTRGGTFGFQTLARGSGSATTNGNKPSKPESYGLWQACGYTVTTDTTDLVNDGGGANTTTSIIVDDGTSFTIGAMIMHDGNPTIITAKSSNTLTVSPALPSIPADDDTIQATHNFRKSTDGDVYGVCLELEIDGLRTTMTGCKGNVTIEEADPVMLTWTFQVDHWIREIEAAPYYASSAYSTSAPSLGSSKLFTLSGTAQRMTAFTASLNTDVKPKQVSSRSHGINGRSSYHVAGYAAGGSRRELQASDSEALPRDVRFTARVRHDLFCAFGSHANCVGVNVPVNGIVETGTPVETDGLMTAMQVFVAHDAGMILDGTTLVKRPDFQVSFS